MVTRIKNTVRLLGGVLTRDTSKARGIGLTTGIKVVTGAGVDYFMAISRENRASLD